MPTLCLKLLMQCALLVALSTVSRWPEQLHRRSKSVPFFETSEDSNGGGDTWLVHIHLLEAALKGRVLLNVLTVLIQSGGTNASQLTTSQHGLQQVACVQKTTVW